MASKRFKKSQQRAYSGPQEQPLSQDPEAEMSDTDLQEKYRHLDRTNAQSNPGLAGTRARRRNNAANMHVARSPKPETESEIKNG
jgi:hypothetical protein